MTIDGDPSAGETALVVDDTDADSPAVAQGIADLCHKALLVLASDDSGLEDSEVDGDKPRLIH